MVQKNGFDNLDLSMDSEYGWGVWEERQAPIRPFTAPSPRLLLVEADQGWQPFLELLLREEGYALQVVSSVEQALARISAQTFDLVLAHLCADTSRQLFRAIKSLRERTAPARLGVITSWKSPAEIAEEQGLAFILSTSLSLEPLLAQIALCLQRPLTGERARQAEIAKRFLEALTLKEHHLMLSLCTEDILCYSLPSSPAPLTEAIRGKEALERGTELLRSRYRALKVEAQPTIYSRPKGLAAPYMLWWVEPDGRWDQKNGCALIQFSGERIRQIGLRTEKN